MSTKTKNPLAVQYAQHLKAYKEAKAFFEVNKPAVIKYLEKNQNSVKTDFGVLIHTTKKGQQNLDPEILNKVPHDVVLKLVKPQIGLAEDLIKAGLLDKDLFNQYVSRGAEQHSVDIK
jgi:hypothetical protein